MLGLEADIRDARFAIRSLLSDLGVESALWRLPNIAQPQPDAVGDVAGGVAQVAADERCFPDSMPLGDFDHLLHLAMTEADEAFLAMGKESWSKFDKQISALSKFFSKRDLVEVYIQRHVNENPRVPGHAKRHAGVSNQEGC